LPRLGTLSDQSALYPVHTGSRPGKARFDRRIWARGFRADHAERLAAYWAEAVGGPATYSGTYGDEASPTTTIPPTSFPRA
jgi:hypothetical protein